jgi:hypothetical protein
MSNKELKIKFGTTMQALPATRALAREIEGDFGGRSLSVLAINDRAGTFTQVNVYQLEKDGGHTGRRYDPVHYTHPLPAEDSPKWKTWAKRGYEEISVSEIGVLKQVKVKAKKAEAASA